MRSTTISRARLLVLAGLAAFAAIVPTASADTTLPTWTCRGSAGYLEVEPLLNEQRVEPVLANGFPVRDEPDSEQCASSAAGVQDVEVPENAPTPLLRTDDAFANTTITPQIGAARIQTASAAGGSTDTTITLGTLAINATVLRADATGTCSGTTPVLTAESTVASLQIGAAVIPILNPTAPQTIAIPLIGTIYLNRQVLVGDATTADQELTQRAIQIELLPGAGGVGTPAVNIVLGEAKVDRTGAVCAAAPPPPTCPAGSVAQDPLATPLVCVLTVTAPCPAGSTADPNAGGACVIIRNNDIVRPCGTGTAANAAGTCVATPTTCPARTVRDPATNTCVLIVERPCPAGATADPATRVCVVQTNTSSSDRENGRIGSPTGPRATCGRVSMRFVRGGRNTLTNTIGTRVVTRGRLVSCGSNPRPIVGARIDVIHVLPDGRRLRKTGLRSRGDGRLTLILPNDLRTRRIEYAYRPDLTTSRVSSRVILRLTVLNRQGRVIR